MKAIEQVTLFYEISNALNEHLDLKKSMYKVLDILSNSMQMERGTISILNPLRNEINIEVAHSLSKSAMERVKYKLGEGIIGRVIETGEAVAIPKISEEPLFLNRTASRRIKGMGEVSFICVPVQKGKRVVGALSVDRAFDPDYPLEEGTKLLSVVATMLARHAINLETIHLEKEALRAENKRLRDELENKYRINNIIGNSNKMREVFQMISQVSRSNATVLIRGESGTGKELVANSIHYNSTRSKGPFVKVNCAAIPNNLIESELFGHEKGAFTGAVKQKPGRFELAHKGTIFWTKSAASNPMFRCGCCGSAGAGVRAGGRAQDDQGGCAHHRSHQQESGTGRGGGFLPGRPVLPPQCVSHLHAPPAGTQNGYSAAGGLLSGALRRRERSGGQTAFHTGHRHAHGLPLARKCT
jgi:Nif-specific regulatory protein